MTDKLKKSCGTFLKKEKVSVPFAAGDCVGDCRQCSIGFSFVFNALLQNSYLELATFVFLSNNGPGDGEAMIPASGLAATRGVDRGYCPQSFIVYRILFFDEGVQPAFDFFR